jgi:hypothetical protein
LDLSYLPAVGSAAFSREAKAVRTVLSQSGEFRTCHILPKAYPTYRKHRASGQAIVTLSGRDHYHGPWQSRASKLEYDRLIAE